MAQKSELIITISAEGQVGVEVDGVRGPSCLELSRDLEEALGRVTKREKKNAFYMAEDGVEELSVHAGKRP